MLTLYRRHTLACGRADRYYKRCACPMWVEGTLERKYMRKSLDTKSWERAKAVVEEWEKTGAQTAKRDVPTLGQAVADYLDELRERELAEQTILNNTYTLSRFLRWADKSNYQLGEIDTPALTEFFRLQRHAASTKVTERGYLRDFFRFCIREKWIKDEPTKGLAKLKVNQAPTEPLDREQFESLVGACDDARTRALVLTLRYSGLRIGDGLRLERSKINRADVLGLHQQKTGQHVGVPLPPRCLAALAALPAKDSRYFIPDGPHTAMAMVAFANRFRLDLAAAAKRAGIGHAHPHQLRDTFAVELLLAGVPLDQVSKLLGHRSIKTTEKHYSPWVKARQAQLEASVRLAWIEPTSPPG